MVSIKEFVRPTHLEDALSIMADPAANARLLAGGTDLLLKYRNQSGPQVTMVDISGIPTLSEITETSDGLRIGATARLVDVVNSAVVEESFPVLAEGAVVVAGPQVRNLATIGGNVCNASPSGDTIPSLLVLDAQAVIASQAAHRTVPLCDFFVGPGRTILEQGELLEALLIPWAAPGTVATYRKLSPRQAMDLAVVGVATALWRESAGWRTRIGLGAVAPTPVRARAAEAVIEQSDRLDPAVAAEAGRVAADEVSPISDVRASAGYRRTMIGRLVTRSLLELSTRIHDTEKE